MTWGMVAVAGAAVVGSVISSNSARSGARQQAAAIREATALQREMYNTTRNDLAQYRDIGGKYTGELDKSMPELTRAFTMSDFVKDPGYDFRMAEGQKALERSASARGGLLGGGAAKALSRYGQDYASNEYNNAYNRFNQDRDQRFNKLSSLSQMGLGAAQGSAQAAQNYANSAGQLIADGGNAAAASTIAQGNAWSNAMNQGAQAYGAYANSNSGKQKMTTQVNWAGNEQPINASQMIKSTYKA